MMMLMPWHVARGTWHRERNRFWHCERVKTRRRERGADQEG